ncbi:uncharacterized protein BJX67DRAFT_75207 [Aspergillus lucknowensis]|uniref:Retrotransposon gag domain-containing protein n=1 Tax=Aspergillus lucknowensis TaxID=176173 RepID=A0ABR4LT42_9EURO
MESHQLQEDELDVKIRQAEEDLAKLRKERSLLELHNQLAEEQRLLSLARQNGTSRHVPIVTPSEPNHFLGRYPVVSLEPDAEQTFKRSDSEATLGELDGIFGVSADIPLLPVTKIYHGANRKEFLLLMRRLEAHFEEWGQYYVTDHRKISEATRHLPEGISVKWALAQLPPQGKRTWSEFCVWLSSNIQNFVNPDVAERRYRSARQRKKQSVSRFAALLGSMEANLPRLVSDDERCRRLWEGVLPEIRSASPYGCPASYHTGVTQLCAAARSSTGVERKRRRRRRGRGQVS